MTDLPSFAAKRDMDRYEIAKLEFVQAATAMRKHLGKEMLERLDPIIKALK